jgi:hypothetical protein
MESRWQASRNARAVYSPLIGVHDHPGHLPAPHGDGHGQRAVSRGGVVAL